jgi:hypothetical protein
MTVATHNPSNLPMKYIEVKIPISKNFKPEKYVNG